MQRLGSLFCGSNGMSQSGIRAAPPAQFSDILLLAVRRYSFPFESARVMINPMQRLQFSGCFECCVCLS